MRNSHVILVAVCKYDLHEVGCHTELINRAVVLCLYFELVVIWGVAPTGMWRACWEACYRTSMWCNSIFNQNSRGIRHAQASSFTSHDKNNTHKQWLKKIIYTNTLPLKSLGLVRFVFSVFLKEVSYAHRCCIYWMKNTVRTVIMWNITIVSNNCCLF